MQSLEKAEIIFSVQLSIYGLLSPKFNLGKSPRWLGGGSKAQSQMLLNMDKVELSRRDALSNHQDSWQCPEEESMVEASKRAKGQDRTISRMRFVLGQF